MKRNIMANKLPNENMLRRIISFTWIKKSALVEIIALLFVILFLYTGIAKLMDFAVFKVQLADSPVLKPVAPLVAWGLPAVEFAVCILLFIPKWRLTGLYATFLLMTTFTAYVLILLTTSPELPCSCGGIIELLSWQGHLIVNTGLVILSLIAIKLARQLKKSVEA